MMVLTEKESRIEEWINIRVSCKNYEVKVWEEECEEPFFEESKTATKNNIDSHPPLYDKAFKFNLRHSVVRKGFVEVNKKGDDVQDVEEIIVRASLEDGEVEVQSQVKKALGVDVNIFNGFMEVNEVIQGIMS